MYFIFCLLALEWSIWAVFCLFVFRSHQCLERCQVHHKHAGRLDHLIPIPPWIHTLWHIKLLGNVLPLWPRCPALSSFLPLSWIMSPALVNGLLADTMMRPEAINGLVHWSSLLVLPRRHEKDVSVEWLLSRRTNVDVAWSRVKSPHLHQKRPAGISWWLVNPLKQEQDQARSAKPSPDQLTLSLLTQVL